MLNVEQIDTRDKAQVERFIELPFRLYRDHPQWVPPFYADVKLQLDRDKHPYYEHSVADFFLAVRDGKPVGRIAAMENCRYNDFHKKRQAQFYLFECENDQDAANELFARVFDWAKKRNLDHVVGPKGFSSFDGYGIQVEGFQHRQMMNMMNYNYDYYPKLVENIGFEKEVDFVSCYMSPKKFQLPERVHRIAERVKARGILEVVRFQTKGDLRAWAQRIGTAYNNTFVNNWEYYPLTEREIQFVLKNLLQVADPRLIKIIASEGQVVGFALGFPDLSAAMQRIKGRLFPFGIVHLLREFKRTKWVSFNGAGVLPEFHGRGGNALLYSEMEKTLHDYNFADGELTQVAETAVQMRHDLINLGGEAYKNHRVYRRMI